MADELQPGAEATTAAEATDAADRPAKKAAAKKTTAKKTAAKKTTAKKATAKRASSADEQLDLGVDTAADAPVDGADDGAPEAPAKKTAAKRTAKKAPAKRAAAKKATAVPAEEATEGPHGDPVDPQQNEAAEQTEQTEQTESSATSVLFQAPEKPKRKSPSRSTKKAAAAADETVPEGSEPPADEAATEKPKKKTTARKKAAAKPDDAPREEEADAEPESDEPDSDESDDAESGDGQGEESGGTARRRRRRGGRRRRRSGDSGDSGDSSDDEAEGEDAAGEESGDRAGDSAEGNGESPSSRRRRRRRRSGDDGGEGGDDPENTVTRVRSKRSVEDEITSISGSTRLEAKKQRRRDGREAGRRRAPIVSEAEFLARREAVDRVMVIRQRPDLIQIGVLEDRVLVEHYVARESQTSLIGNVYIGRVQNVLPSMEAAFIDIGKGRNAVLYAGEVNWSALGHKEGQPRKIENVLSSGQTVLVQVTKDPIGHKGARLTSQISLAGRFLVYVPDGTTSGISRKLPDTERHRLKSLLKEIVPDTAGVIVRTAAEGASEDELTRDVERLKARWEDIEAKARGNAPSLLYGEPDLTLKVVRDLFTEDFSKLVIQGEDAWETVQSYVAHVAPDLEERLVRYDPGPDGHGGKADVFAEYRIEEQISKGLDRKVWLPSGGSLIIDRTEAMTVVDVNTGKFTGSGGNLEETVTKNNLEAAEEIVRQLRLRDIGGIIVVDFIDMVLESNRDLVLRRLVECLGRDRTRHQVAEVTSLGLVQMTRKRIGTGLLEAFSENCEHCQGRGLVIHEAPVEPKRGGGDEESRRGGGRRGRGRGRGQDSDGGGNGGNGGGTKAAPSPKDVAAMARHEQADPEATDEPETPVEAEAPVEAEPAEASAPETPKVTTRSRGRRSASRPAAAPPEPEAESAPEPEPVVETPASEPEAQPESQPDSQPETAPEPPKVVTRTRGRRATRPAGPPAGEEVAATPPPGALGSVGEPPADGVVEPGTAGAEPGGEPVDEAEAPHVEHVPIKKKGSRKR